jgi:hypothetical protein
MAEHLEPEKQHLDDQLVEFTDRLLAGETTEEFPMDTPSTELSSYQEIVLRMKHVAGEVTPAPALREKIRARLVAEWQKAGFQQAASPKIQPRGWVKSTRSGRRQFLYRLAFVMVVVLLASFFLFPHLDSGLSGASGGQSSWLYFIVIALVILLGFALWWYSRRRQ